MLEYRNAMTLTITMHRLCRAKAHGPQKWLCRFWVGVNSRSLQVGNPPARGGAKHIALQE